VTDTSATVPESIIYRCWLRRRRKWWDALAKLEIALIGAGLIARIHLDAWVKAGACVRIYATDDRATILAREFGATAVDS
jgi:hypothetical protein